MFSLIKIDVHLVAVLKAPETYENISTGFNNVFQELNQLIAVPQLTVNDEVYKLKFYISCDYKVSIIASYMYMWSKVI